MGDGSLSKEILYKFLVDFQKIKNYTPSYFDILGISKRELSYSSFLKFFFDTKERHYLKDLFIKSLLDCIGENTEENIETEEILLEYMTKKNGRIDIIIKTKKLIIVIENKIEANLQNDLKDYYESVKKDFEGKNIKYIVLSMNKIKEDVKLYEFKNILYSEFVNKLKLNLHNYISDVNNYYLLLFKEFIKHIDNYNKNDYFEKAKFYFNNRDIIDDLENNTNNSIYLENKVLFKKIIDTKRDYYNYLAKQITQIACLKLLNIESIKDFVKLTEIRRNKETSNSKIGLRNKELEEYGIFFLWIRMCNDGKSLRISTDIEDSCFYKNDTGNIKLKELIRKLKLKDKGFESKGFSAIYRMIEIETFSNENDISDLIVKTINDYWGENIGLIKELLEGIKELTNKDEKCHKEINHTHSPSQPCF